MASKIQQSTFVGGLDKDSSDKLVPSNKYIDASNVRLTEDGEFRSITNFKGTSKLATLNSSLGDVNVLGAFQVNCKIDGFDQESMIVFTLDDSVYKIIVVKLASGTTYEVHSRSVDAAFVTSRPTVDAVLYAEGGVDILYFTDNYHSIGKFICDITSSTSLEEEDLVLAKQAPRAYIDLGTTPVSDTGGSLLCGSYQFVVRLYDSTKQRYSHWTIPTLPVRIHTVNETGVVAEGLRGKGTAKSISFNIITESSEREFYDYFQVGVLEHVNSGVNATTVSIQELETLVDDTENFIYKSNSKVGDASLDDVTIENAAIKSVKTLETKLNRLFGANVTYKELDYDNGTPNVGGGGVLRDNSGEKQSYKDDNFATTNVGYWRGEVYRFAISYFDKDYNFSEPSVLDLSSLTDNQISGAIDFKFPTRDIGGYELLNQYSYPRALGLTLNNITNHPSWAKGFIILRAKRKKDIQFQTPIIPTCLVQPASIQGNYPESIYYRLTDSQPTTLWTVDEGIEIQAASNQLGSYVPKSYMRSIAQSIIRRAEEDTDVDSPIGECYYQAPVGDGSSYLSIVYNPKDLFTDQSGLEIGEVEQEDYNNIKLIDHALLKVDFNDYAGTLGTEEKPNGVTSGEYKGTAVHGGFHADNRQDYFFSHGANADRDADVTSGDSYRWNGNIKEYGKIPENADGVTLVSGFPNKATAKICDYNGIMPSNDSLGLFGKTPNTQKASYIVTDNAIGDVAYNSYNALKIMQFDEGLVVGSGYKYGLSDNTINTNVLTNVESYPNKFATKNDTIGDEYMSAVDIANITKGLEDSRYGDATDDHEYISTGAYHVFTDSELSDIENNLNPAKSVDVWGGDCFISYVTYKVNDSTFSITNIGKQYGLNTVPTGGDNGKTYSLNVWRQYSDSAGANQDTLVSSPVALDYVSETVSLYIESEYDLDIRFKGAYAEVQGDSEPVRNIPSSAVELRDNFNYIIQPEYSIEDNSKIFNVNPTGLNLNYTFPSRLVYTDQKIYQSDEEGFDSFRVLNAHDLDESNGGITKLVRSNDRLYAIQESSVVYLPIDANVIETAEGGNMAVRSGDLVGRPIYVNNNLGTKFIRSVSKSNNAFFFADTEKRQIVKIGGDGFDIISDKGMISEFSDKLGGIIYDNDIRTSYDQRRRDLLVYTQTNTTDNNINIYNELIGGWVSSLPNASAFMNMSTGDHGVYLLGSDVLLDGYFVWELYNGDLGEVFGEFSRPYVQFVVNQTPEITKIYDNLRITSNEALLDVDFATGRPSIETAQTASFSLAKDVTGTRGEGNWRLQIPRDATNGRLRGTHMLTTLNWVNSDTQTAVQSILTKYRESKRIM